MSVPDYTFGAKVVMDPGRLIGLVVRFSYTEDHVYILGLAEEFGGLALAIGDEFGFTPLDTYSVTVEYGQPYWMRFEINGNLLGGKIWTGTPGDEPSEWMVTASDGSITDPGSIGLFGMAPSETSLALMECRFDDVEVTDDVTLELSGETRGSIKCSLGPTGRSSTGEVPAGRHAGAGPAGG